MSPRPALKLSGKATGRTTLVFDSEDMNTLAAALAPLVAAHMRGDTRGEARLRPAPVDTRSSLSRFKDRLLGR